MKFRAAAALNAALLLALGGFASSALAGDHGNNGKKVGQQTTTSQTTTAASDDNSTGVKPSNTTAHDTKASASSNQTKQYGNGKTAGEIATQAGYGSATLHGPGNSQPHKVNCGGHEVDVHALKHKKCDSTESATATTTQAVIQTATSVVEASHKVTICHKTGSATNPYVEITVDYHALKNGHTAAKGDIIPAPASGCPKPPAPVVTTAAAQAAAESQNCTTTKVETEQVVIGVEHFIGPKGSGRYVIIHPNANSAHYRDKHPDVLIYGPPVTKTVTVASPCPSTTTTVETTTTSTTIAAAVAAPPAPPAAAALAATPVAAGGVLGAVSPLQSASPTPKATGGVLGSIVGLGKSTGTSILPFTGLPLWIFALVALGLIVVGAGARRATTER